MEGYEVLPALDAAERGDLFITVTGNRGVLRGEHFERMKDGAVIANAGHFDVEVDIARSAARRRQGAPEDVLPLVERYELDGRKLNLLAGGRVVNLAAAQGHPAEVMDISFALQALAIEWLATREEAPRAGRRAGAGTRSTTRSRGSSSSRSEWRSTSSRPSSARTSRAGCADPLSLARRMKAMVLAAGLGTRLKPITFEIPKPMVPVLDRPVMAHIVNLLHGQGFDDLIANLHYFPNSIKNYFGDSAHLQLRGGAARHRRRRAQRRRLLRRRPDRDHLGRRAHRHRPAQAGRAPSLGGRDRHAHGEEGAGHARVRRRHPRRRRAHPGLPGEARSRRGAVGPRQLRHLRLQPARSSTTSPTARSRTGRRTSSRRCSRTTSRSTCTRSTSTGTTSARCTS